jgi:hypothetical protein
MTTGSWLALDSERKHTTSDSDVSAILDRVEGHAEQKIYLQRHRAGSCVLSAVPLVVHLRFNLCKLVRRKMSKHGNIHVLMSMWSSRLQFHEEPFDRVEARRVRGQIEQHHTNFLAHLLPSI